MICRAMVCRKADYHDHDCMLTLLSPECGRIDAIARGCKKPISRLHAAAQLFVVGEYSFRERNGYCSVVQCDILESFFSIAEDIRAFTVGEFVLQSSVDTAQPQQSANDLFRLAYYVLSYLGYGEGNPVDICLYYMLHILQIQGLRPATVTCALCGRSTFEKPTFHAEYGALCYACSTERGEVKVDALTLEAMVRMMRLPLEELKRLVLPVPVREQMMDVLPPFFEKHMDHVYTAFSQLKKIEKMGKATL